MIHFKNQNEQNNIIFDRFYMTKLKIEIKCFQIDATKKHLLSLPFKTIPIISQKISLSLYQIQTKRLITKK